MLKNIFIKIFNQVIIKLKLLYEYISTSCLIRLLSFISLITFSLVFCFVAYISHSESEIIESYDIGIIIEFSLLVAALITCLVNLVICIFYSIYHFCFRKIFCFNIKPFKNTIFQALMLLGLIQFLVSSSIGLLYFIEKNIEDFNTYFLQ